MLYIYKSFELRLGPVHAESSLVHLGLGLLGHLHHQSHGLGPRHPVYRYCKNSKLKGIDSITLLELLEVGLNGRLIQSRGVIGSKYDGKLATNTRLLRT